MPAEDLALGHEIPGAAAAAGSHAGGRRGLGRGAGGGDNDRHWRVAGAGQRDRSRPPMRWGGRSPPWCWSGGAGRWRCCWRRRRSCSSTTSSTTRASIPRCRSRWRWPPPGRPATASGRCWSPAGLCSPASGSATRPCCQNQPARPGAGRRRCETPSCSRRCCCSGRRCAPAAPCSVEQERSERLLLNVLPAPIADRLKPREDGDRRRVPRGHRAVRRPGGLHPAQPAQQPASRWCRS